MTELTNEYLDNLITFNCNLSNETQSSAFCLHINEFNIETNVAAEDNADLQNIFDPFITKKKDGKGLGLSIVSNSIRTLDGSIEVSSENGRTNFCLNFPLKKY